MVKEEGIGVLTDAIPVFVAKQVPYAAVKFTIFDLTTEYLYQIYPLAQEDLKLSLGISLIGGVLAGIAAAAVSKPADAVISEFLCDFWMTSCGQGSQFWRGRRQRRWPARGRRLRSPFMYSSYSFLFSS